MIQNLPLEVVNRITYSLPPADALHLAYTSKHLYNLVRPRLYCSITVDSGKYPYDHEVIRKNSTTVIPGVFGNSKVYIKSTKIKSLYALHLIFKNLIENPEYCRDVHVLNLNNIIPDIPEVELFDKLLQIFPNLVNLKNLNWLVILIYLNCGLMSLLPNPSNLISFTANLKNFEHLRFDISHELQLKELNVSGFNTVTNLSKIDLSLFPNLHKLIVSKNSSISNELISIQQSNNNQYTVSDLIEIQEPFMVDGSEFLKALFGKKFHHKLNLSILILRDLIFRPEDANYLIENINLENLEELSINNCSELLFEDSFSQTSPLRRNPPLHLFLDILLPHLKNVQSLDINLNNELYYNEKLFQFLENLPTKLLKLSVYLTFNNYDNINAGLAKFFQAILPHAETLHYLNFNFNIINLATNLNINNVVKPTTFNYSIKAIQDLSKLTNLVFLRLPLNQFQITDFFKIVGSCHKLRFFKINLFNSTIDTPSPATINSLISQDYFTYPNSVTCNYNSTKIEQYKNYCIDFKCLLKQLHYMCLEKNGELLVFDCEKPGLVLLKEGLCDFFDHLITSVFSQ